MEKLQLQDSFRVSDSKITGYVVIKENGKIIVKKENMIVEGGRKYIKDRVFGASAATINKIVFGTNTKVVESNDSLGTISQYRSYSVGSGLTINTSANRDVVITVTLTKLTDDASISELGLVLSDNETLFSRLVFDAIPLTADHTYEITYYIYF